MPEKYKQLIHLDVGCGFRKNDGFIGMDRREVPGVDIVHDAEDLPWPLEDESCAVITMSHLIEHVKPWLTVDIIDECWRVLEPGGVLLIVTPYATSFGYYQDPTHCNPWNEATVTYFIQEEPLYEIYRPKPWKLDNLFWNLYGNIEIAMRKLNEN
jgi:predicted SAM-dependent methyltransferase